MNGEPQSPPTKDERCAYQQRYIAYCSANGRSPSEMLRDDGDRYPGGIMCGYMLWIHERWREWRKLTGRGSDSILSNDDHSEFDRWLNTTTTFQKAA